MASLGPEVPLLPSQAEDIKPQSSDDKTTIDESVYDVARGGHYGASVKLAQSGRAPPQEHFSGAFSNVSQGLGAPFRDILHTYWQHQIIKLETEEHDYKLHHLPLARIKKVMKADPDVKMISAEAPILFAKGCDIFITELTMRAWIIAEENKRRTLQRSDIASALTKSDMFDFLIDIVPREELAQQKRHMETAAAAAAAAAAGVAPLSAVPHSAMPHSAIPHSAIPHTASTQVASEAQPPSMQQQTFVRPGQPVPQAHLAVGDPHPHPSTQQRHQVDHRARQSFSAQSPYTPSNALYPQQAPAHPYQSHVYQQNMYSGPYAMPDQTMYNPRAQERSGAETFAPDPSYQHDPRPNSQHRPSSLMVGGPNANAKSEPQEYQDRHDDDLAKVEAKHDDDDAEEGGDDDEIYE